MITKCYNLDLNDATANIIRTIAMCVPCFIDLTPNVSNTEAEYTICARQEDWAWIEKKLASIV